MKLYPAYKDSGVEWLGEIPEHWDMARIKHLAWFKYGDSLIGDSRESGKIPVYGSNGQVGTHSCSNTHSPCIIIGRKGSYGKVNYSPSSSFAIDTTFFVDDTSTKCDIRWLFYCLSIVGLDIYSQDSAVPGLSRDYAHNLWLPRIALSEQRDIADFLDHETARIDALIAKYQRLIDLLEEKRISIIGQAVTKGLDESVPLKETGISWFGKVPAQWEIKKLKHVIDKAISGPFGSSLTKDMYSSTGYRVYGQEQVIPDDFSIGDYFIHEEQFREMEKYAVNPGDVLVSCVGTFGKVAVVPIDITPGIINPRLIKLKPNQSKITSSFLKLLLQSKIAYSQMEKSSHGGTMGIINLAVLENIILPLPSIHEQDVISVHVTNVTEKINKVVSKINRSISKLNEYRASLISATVTGKNNVSI